MTMVRAAAASALLLAAALLAGCRPVGTDPAPKSPLARTAASLAGSLEAARGKVGRPLQPVTQVSTRPSRAYIEVNGEYAGKSPCGIRWYEFIKDRPTLAAARVVTIKAYPVTGKGDQRTQVRVYDLANPEVRDAFPPRALHFDLGLLPMGKGEEER